MEKGGHTIHLEERPHTQRDYSLLQTVGNAWSSHESSPPGLNQSAKEGSILLPALPLRLPMTQSPIYLASNSKIPLATVKATRQGQPLVGEVLWERFRPLY